MSAGCGFRRFKRPWARGEAQQLDDTECSAEKRGELSVYASIAMSKSEPSFALNFITQRPREDGCGGVVLQMLTGLPFDEIMGRIGWCEHDLRRSTWDDLIRILGELGWQFGEPVECTEWSAVKGIAIVHVHDDHFMLYDADNAIFYDPFEFEGPQTTSKRLPMRYLTVVRPTAA
jgi:hypothetical protein